MDREKYVDESWKDSVASEKEQMKEGDQEKTTEDKAPSPSSSDAMEQQQEPDSEIMEVNFMNYVTSLTFQAMIFLGEIPHPMDENKIEKNLTQAKLLIDTLIMIREKTKGNLAKQEEDFINATLYELQMKYVEHLKMEKPSTFQEAP